MKKKLLLIYILTLFFTLTGYAQSAPAPSDASAFTGKPQYQIITKRASTVIGNVKVELFPLIAPLHVKNFDDLVKVKFYDTTAFHRVIPKFMIQGGDPNSRRGPKSTWGQGNPNQPKVKAEFSAAQHLRGTLSAARTDDVNSATSQFFICVANYPSLDGKYSVYGHVVAGMPTVDNIVNSPRDANDNPNQKIEMFISYLGSNDTIPQAPIMVSPAKGTKEVPLNKPLIWNAVNDAILYTLEVATDSLFSKLIFTTSVPVTSATATGLKNGTRYYWRVKTNNGGNYSPYSEVWNFTTPGFTTVEDIAQTANNGYLLKQNIPNPANVLTTVNYVLPVSGKARLALYDIQGREVMLLVNELKDKGEHQIKFSLDDLQPGIYFYQLQTGGFIATKKLIRN